jgi:hypothetical protein
MELIHNYWFAAAGVAAAVTMLLHLVVGGRYIARPLLRSSEMTPTAKFTNYYCWHLVTIYIGLMSFSFFGAAIRVEGFALGMIMTIAAALNTILSIAIILITRQSFKKMPQWALFFIIFVFAALGVRSATYLAF